MSLIAGIVCLNANQSATERDVLLMLEQMCPELDAHVETYVNPSARSITWKFYSTSDGRQVNQQSRGLVNTVDPPKPIFEENSDLAKGEVEQVDWAVQGADVRITRNVTRNGQLLFNDEFTTHYQPWAMVCQYGPKTKDYPPKEIDDDLTSCNI